MLSRIAADDINMLRFTDVFDCATIHGAEALGRLEGAQTHMCADATRLDFLGHAHVEPSPLTLAYRAQAAD